MTRFMAAIALCLSTTALWAQPTTVGEVPLAATQPYIEVTGTAELEIIPDEIYVAIELRERTENKEKISVERQEADLKTKLREAGIDLNKLTLSGANLDLLYISRRKKESISTKNLQLLLSTADQVNKAFEIFDQLKLQNTYIARTSHSKIEQFKRDVKISAMRATRDKAAYLLDAIGQKIGKPLFIQETQDYAYNPSGTYNMRANIAQVSNEYKSNDEGGGDDVISFSKIKLTCSIFARFQIAE